MPASAMPSVNSVVATGRRMKSGRAGSISRGRPPDVVRPRLERRVERPPRSRRRQPIEEEIDDRRGEEGQHLAHDQAADDGDAQRMAQLGADAGAQHQRQRAEQRRHGGHQDRAEAQQAGLMDRLARRLALAALGLEREVDHHDRVLLDDADQQDDADDGDDVESCRR